MATDREQRASTEHPSHVRVEDSDTSARSRRPEILLTWLVVLLCSGVLGLGLLAHLFPEGGGGAAANSFVTKQHLRWQWTQHELYAQRYGGRLTSQTGHRFVLMPWVEKLCQRNEQSFERFWVYGANEHRRAELAEQARDTSWDEIWTDYGDVSSEDTHFAGPSAEQLGRLDLTGGSEPMMATDNEFGPLLFDFSVLVLMDDGGVLEIEFDELRDKYGFTGEGEEKEVGFPVGPESPHPMLQKLEY